MAETFVAVRRGPAGFEQRVCLKRILPGCAADPTFVELFLDEARLLARLQCRNIVHVYDFGESEGTYYMALELVDGVDLEGLLTSLRGRGVRMSPSVALYVIGEVLAALSYAHTLEIDDEPQHIVHRDISPSNILISKNGEVKLTDFGIAKARGRSHRTQTGHTKGKVAYMSPEQMRADPVDGRSDLFAIGVVLFELLTGAHPFDATTDFALQLNIMNGKRPPLRELLPDAPARIAQLVDTLLATDANQRPESAADAIALIPPLESAFSLQRELQQLVATRDGGASAGPASSSGAQRVLPGSTPSRASDVGHSPTQHAPASASGDRVPVAARHTTDRSRAEDPRSSATPRPSRSRLVPALVIGLATLLLGLGYAVLRNERGAPASATGPAQPGAPAQLPAAPVGTALPTPERGALPDDPHAATRAPQATAPLGVPRVQTPAPSVVGTETPALDQPEPGASHRHHHHKARERAAAGDPNKSKVDTTTSSATRDDDPGTFVSAARPTPPADPEPPPVGPSQRPGSEARAIIQAPHADQATPVEARKAYVTPSGRVILPAPPL